MTKAILINAKAKTVTQVEVGEGIQDIYKHLECHTFDVVNLGRGVGCYVDDESLLKTAYIDDDGVKHNMNGFSFAGMDTPLMGNGLIMGSNDEGESIDSPISVEQVARVLTFVEYDKPEERPEPQMSFSAW